MDVAPHMNPILNFEPTGNSRYTTEFLALGKVLKINHFVQNNSRETRFYSLFFEEWRWAEFNCRLVKLKSLVNIQGLKKTIKKNKNAFLSFYFLEHLSKMVMHQQKKLYHQEQIVNGQEARLVYTKSKMLLQF